MEAYSYHTLLITRVFLYVNVVGILELLMLAIVELFNSFLLKFQDAFCRLFYMFGEGDLSSPGRSELRTPHVCESGSWQSGSGRAYTRRQNRCRCRRRYRWYRYFIIFMTRQYLGPTRQSYRDDHRHVGVMPATPKINTPARCAEQMRTRLPCDVRCFVASLEKIGACSFVRLCNRSL
jgi:hypothetical protein